MSKENGTNVLKWDAIDYSIRLRIVLQTKLPTSLATAKWFQLTESEQDEIYMVNWFALYREVQP